MRTFYKILEHASCSTFYCHVLYGTSEWTSGMGVPIPLIDRLYGIGIDDIFTSKSQVFCRFSQKTRQVHCLQVHVDVHP